MKSHLSSACLADHALGHDARLESIIQSQSPNVRVRANTLDASQITNLCIKLYVAGSHGGRGAQLALGSAQTTSSARRGGTRPPRAPMGVQHGPHVDGKANKLIE